MTALSDLAGCVEAEMVSATKVALMAITGPHRTANREAAAQWAIIAGALRALDTQQSKGRGE